MRKITALDWARLDTWPTFPSDQCCTLIDASLLSDCVFESPTDHSSNEFRKLERYSSPSFMLRQWSSRFRAQRAKSPGGARHIARAWTELTFSINFLRHIEVVFSRHSLSFAGEVFILRLGIDSARWLLMTVYFFFSLVMLRTVLSAVEGF